MPREKIVRHTGREFHRYTEDEWSLLKKFRKHAIHILDILEQTKIKGFVHGSVARGDINDTSDIDIHIPIQIPSFKLDLIDDLQFIDRRIIMGTPNSTIRGILSTHDEITISFPLTIPNEREDEFFRFSGLLYSDDLKMDRRVAGVTKQLLLIEPEEEGYWLSSIIKYKSKAIRILSISQRIIEERIRVLDRRDQIGRTGVFLDHTLAPNENFEHVLKSLADKNVIVRRMVKRK
ncbi:MAG: hypothetical protein ACFFCU_16420 [Promethearchaeota archaeon]